MCDFVPMHRCIKLGVKLPQCVSGAIEINLYAKVCFAMFIVKLFKVGEWLYIDVKSTKIVWGKATKCHGLLNCLLIKFLKGNWRKWGKVIECQVIIIISTEGCLRVRVLIGKRKLS